MSEGKKKFFDNVNKYTKYKLVERITKNYSYETLDSVDKIEELADDVMTVLSICGLKFYGELHNRRNNESR
tara:strand:+ start:43 stop:255 length:213 start_codon:yes stop_codon:yes gene_type:complete